MNIFDSSEYSDQLPGILFLVFLVGMGIFLVYCVAQVIVSSSADAKCARHGWPSSSVTWNFDKYCVKRINQTDSVIPMENLR